MPPIDARTNLVAIRTEGDALAAGAHLYWDRPVPGCPGWTVADAVGHTASVHRWVTATLDGQKVRRRDLPGPPEGQAAGLAWYSDGLDDLVAHFEAADPESEVWTFGASGDRRVAWWSRRMALETAIHRFDVESAGGDEPPRRFDPDLAVTGIDEYLDDFLPGLAAQPAGGGTLHLHSNDVAGEWVVDLSEPSAPVRREHTKADTALRGPAGDILLWLWNRQPADGHLEVFGDRGVVDGWGRFEI